MTLAVGLVGFGLAGRILHAPLILGAGLRIAAVVTSQRQAVQSALPTARVVPDLESLLAIQPLDVVVIATPNELHVPQALSALRAGKHVVIDKPMALSTVEADTLIAAAGRSGRVLTVFHNRRWDSDFLTVQRLLAEDTLGEISSVECHWDRWRPQVADRWRERPTPGSGMLYDLGPHLIDQVLQLFGLPEWLQADVFMQRAGGHTDDAFDIRMGRGRLRITLSVNSLVADAGPRFRLCGSRGTFTKHGLDVQETQLRNGMLPDHDQYGIEPPLQWGRFVAGDTGAPIQIPSEPGNWLNFYRDLTDCIATGRAPVVSASQAREVLKVIEAAQLSSAQGSRVTFNWATP